jgi:Mce-associated membrane protein
MTGTAIAKAPTKTTNMEKIVDFSPESLKAPFFLRCGSLCIDYIVMVAAPLIWLLFPKLFGGTSTTASIGTTGWIIAVILGFANLIVFPLLRGKTLGKAVTGLTIVKMDGTAASIGNILLRNGLGYLLTAATLGLGFLIAAVNGSGRALHDFIGGTIVVSGSRRRKL